MTTSYRWFLARWAKRMCWKDVATAFHVSWDRVFTAVKQAVFWGLEHRDLEDIEAIGVDEVQWHRGHQYQTVVYQLDEANKRLLWIGPDRTTKTLLRFFRMLGRRRSAALRFVVTLQRLMRHKSYTTTQKYINMAGQLNRAVENLYVPDVLKKKA